MRIELAGSLVQLDPLVVIFTVDQDFNPSVYTSQGYTNFDVICIGAGGGEGGGIDTGGTGTTIKALGGAGGGGGFHRVFGLLSALPTTCPVVVGVAGAAGTDAVSNPALTTDGEDGTYSSFNDTTCRASGGEGGKRVQSNSDTVSTEADGGQGGTGDRTTVGGGGEGGTAGTPSPSGPGTAGTDGSDGTFAENIGQGGGGGAGGVGKLVDPYPTCNAATSGGRGSFNPNDKSVYGLGYSPEDFSEGLMSGHSLVDVIPGKASGAKAAPLTGLLTVYGKSGENGVVVVRLTAE